MPGRAKLFQIKMRWRPQGRLAALTQARRGVALVEFALLLPVLLMLLVGIVTYGNYFYLSHTVQQLANDAARSAIPGLTAAERKTLAESAVQLAAQEGAVNPDRLDVEAIDEDPFVRVRVRYDASDAAIFKISLLPMPDPVISRSAAVRMGGL